MICLIKPIYEVESSEIRRSGNINQREVLRDILQDICCFYLDNDVDIIGLINSPVTGNSGTLEFLIGICWNYDEIEKVKLIFKFDGSGSRNKFYDIKKILKF